MQTELLVQTYQAVRAQSMRLAEPLSAEDCCVQSMPDASPVKWHLAHTTWFFETFILARFEENYQPFHPAFKILFNSYYEGVGAQHPRNQRGLMTRPGLHQIYAYRQNVDQRMQSVLAQAAGRDPERVHQLTRLVELGLHHEQQHQELLLMDVKHLLAMNPLFPAYFLQEAPAVSKPVNAPLTWHPFEASVVEIGHVGEGFYFDNETPRHRQFIESFSLASRLVSNREYLAFIEEGGYQNPLLWLSAGWDWISQQRISQPLYWHKIDGQWHEFTLHGLQPLVLEAAVLHISFYEAEAYARWCAARLPSEAEWEWAAATQAEDQFGVAWQWTSSSYAPYPGYKPLPGVVGEYNGKFMVNQYVLRGSSAATPEAHARRSYRNFFPASARWQFSGIRLARSCTGDGEA